MLCSLRRELEEEREKNRKRGKIWKNRHSYQLLDSSGVELQDEGRVKGQHAYLVARFLEPASQVGLSVSWPLRDWVGQQWGLLHAMIDRHCGAEGFWGQDTTSPEQGLANPPPHILISQDVLKHITFSSL